jgi:ComF family protein
MKGFKAIKKFLLDVLFPPRCAGCKKEGEYVCEECKLFLGEASLICPFCRQSSFSGERHERCSTKYGLDGLVAVWEYEGVVKNFVYKIKKEKVTDAVPFFAEMSLNAMLKDSNRFSSFFNFLAKKNPCMTFVPMSSKEEKKQGFNHSELIARELGRLLGIKVFPLLQKEKEADSPGLDKEERLKRVKGAFSAINGIKIPENVILVDDFWVSGATMQECCRILKEAGAKTIWGLVFARAV